MVRSSSGWLGRAFSPSAVAVAASVASGIFPGAGRAETKIVVGIVSHGTSQWPQYGAEELGWFKQRGLALDMVSVGSGGAQQLSAGASGVSHSGFPEFIRAANQGAHVKMVINDISVPPYAVFAKPAIKRIADLRGKTISIGGIKDVTLIYIKPLLASAGLSPSDVDFVYAKAAGDRFSALAGGAVDSAILNPPSSLLAAEQAPPISARSGLISTISRSRCGRSTRTGPRETSLASSTSPRSISTRSAGFTMLATRRRRCRPCSNMHARVKRTPRIPMTIISARSRDSAGMGCSATRPIRK